MMRLNALLISGCALLISFVVGQKKGHQTQEQTLDISFEKCSRGGCVQQRGGITIDSNWRWVHHVSLSPKTVQPDIKS